MAPAATAGPSPLPLKRYDLYELAGPLAGEHPGARACGVLPYAAIPPGAPVPAGWPVVAAHPGYRADRINLLAVLDWMIGLGVDVISLSVGFHAAPNPADPLHVATRTASDRGISVVVAAGNDGPADDSLQELARDPWVIAVGAAGPDGAALASSSRGSASVPGPAVLADGSPPGLHYQALVTFSDGEPEVRSYPPEHPGTSFAAPRVANVMVFIRKVLETCRALHQVWQSGERLAVIPLPVIGSPGDVDSDFLSAGAGQFRTRLQLAGQDEVRFPVRPPTQQWFDALAGGVAEARRELTVDAQTARRVLCALAQPAHGEPWETGAGVVSLSAARSYFAALTPSRWLDIFLPPGAADPAAVRRLDSELEPFWSRTDLDLLEDIFATGVRLAVTKVR
jgi:Subtilase family